MSRIEDRLAQIGLEPHGDSNPMTTGRGTCKFKIFEDLLIVGGIAPVGDDGKPVFVGRLGKEFTEEEGYKAARLVGLNMLETIKTAIGDLDRVEYIIKVMALVNSVKGFEGASRVADGFTDVMTEALGERGMHVRTDFGATNLHDNVPVICDAIIKIRD